MFLLARHLDDGMQAELSTRVTSTGARLDDVIRSGVREPGSAVGVYAPDAESYSVFRELFDPILRDFQAPVFAPGQDLACLDRAAVVSTRIRVARNLAGHAFPARMTRAQRQDVQARIERACEALALQFPGRVIQLGDLTEHQQDALAGECLAFGPHDAYMAAANIHDDWPFGRSVFNTYNHQLSVWINEEDHLRVAVVLPGASVPECAALMAQAMDCLASQLDFAVDAQHGHLTSCPTNAGSAMRVSFRVRTAPDTAQTRQLEQLAAAGILQVRGAAGEHSGSGAGLVDVSFRKRVGLSGAQMLQDAQLLL